MDEPGTKRDKLAQDVLRLSRNTLLVNLRFLDMALSRLQYESCDRSTLMTDGERLIYNAAHVLRCYKSEKEIPVRDYLHIVLHCVYRHMFMNPTLDRALWDLSCDIAVENVITELGLKSTAAKREQSQAQEIAKLKQDLKLLTAEKIYAYFRDKNLSPLEAADLRGLFYADNHEIWYMTSEQAAAAFGLPPSAGVSGDGQDDDSGDGQGSGEAQDDGSGGGQGDGEAQDGNSGGMTPRMVLSNAWKDIAEQTQTELMNALRTVRTELTKPNADAEQIVEKQIGQCRDRLSAGKLSSSLSDDAKDALHGAIAVLEAELALLQTERPASGTAAFTLLKKDFDNRTATMKKQATDTGKSLSNAFKFCEETFGEGQELLILVTELTINPYASRFISRYGCKEYFAHNKELLFYERQKEIITEIEKLELEEI